MALSQTPWVWVATGLVVRLLMAGVLAVSVLLKYTNHVRGSLSNGDGLMYELQSYTYAAVTAGVAGALGVALQAPVAVYFLCMYRVKRREPSLGVLNASMYADMAASLVLASGVGAGFGATNDARQLADGWVRWERDDTKRGLDGYYDRGAVTTVFLLVGLLLSMCASVVSARLRARAGEGHLLV